MPVFHLDLEIDSATYPELHQVLSTVDNSSFRAERIRQLAATGLIWERLRLASGSSRDSTPTPPRMELVSAVKPSRQEALGLPVLRDEVLVRQLPRTEDAETLSIPETPPGEELGKTDASAITADTHVEMSPSVQMPGTRARLMRMKRRGLFANE